LFDPEKDLPVKTIRTIIEKSLNLYRSGIVKLK